MIYITGDVHTKIKGNWEQKIGSEISAAKKYLEILQRYNLKSTLFINGICLDKETSKVKELLNFDVELGGHTYNNFGNIGRIGGYLNRKVFGCVYGRAGYQKKDIKKTRRAFERFGLKMDSWRTHAFSSNNKTFHILREEGVKYVSDFTGDILPFKKEGIIHLPINIPVDQNTISYGKLKPENRDPLASCVKSRIRAEEWFEILKKRVSYNEKNKIDSILLIHPETMAVLDNFKIFGEVAKFLSRYKSAKICEWEKFS